jgi:phosphohistidine phosphatase
MNLYIVRHGAAVDRSDAATDEMRYLTAEGRSSFRKTARTVLKQGVEPSLILTSPLIRAVQTAEILAETLGFAGLLQVRDELAPGFDLRKLQSVLREFPADIEVVIVGHEPDLGILVAELLTLPASSGLKKGAVVKLKVEPQNLRQGGVFKWLALGKKLVREWDISA